MKSSKGLRCSSVSLPVRSTANACSATGRATSSKWMRPFIGNAALDAHETTGRDILESPVQSGQQIVQRCDRLAVLNRDPA